MKTRAGYPQKAPRKDFHFKLFKNPPELTQALILSAVKKAENGALRTFVAAILVYIFLIFGNLQIFVTMENWVKEKYFKNIFNYDVQFIGKTYFIYQGGIWVGFSGSVALSISGGISQEIRDAVPIIPKLAIALTFPVGLVLILMVGGELFTGNVMTMILGLMTRKVTVKDWGINWVSAYLGNFIGTSLLAVAFHYAGVYNHDPWLTFIAKFTHDKIYAPWEENFLRAILANTIVCAAVCVSTCAEDLAGKILGIYIVISIFVISGFEHCIANMFFLTAGLLEAPELHEANSTIVSYYGDFLWRNLLPVTIGNIIGPSVLLTPFLYYLFYRVKPLPEKGDILENESPKEKRKNKHRHRTHKEHKKSVPPHTVVTTKNHELSHHSDEVVDLHEVEKEET